MHSADELDPFAVKIKYYVETELWSLVRETEIAVCLHQSTECPLLVELQYGLTSQNRFVCRLTQPRWLLHDSYCLVHYIMVSWVTLANCGPSMSLKSYYMDEDIYSHGGAGNLG